jgi:hypothetical protein
MLLVRLAAILVVITLGASFVLFLVTRQRRYLDFAWKLFRLALLFVLVFLALFFLERVIAI